MTSITTSTVMCRKGDAHDSPRAEPDHLLGTLQLSERAGEVAGMTALRSAQAVRILEGEPTA
jgi:hypothetical protein